MSGRGWPRCLRQILTAVFWPWSGCFLSVLLPSSIGTGPKAAAGEVFRGASPFIAMKDGIRHRSSAPSFHNHMSGVFISYRRSDGGGWAGRLNDHLSLRFGSNVVWQDVHDLEVGKDYLPQIFKQIASSSAVLIVIGPHWLKDGQKRLQNPQDVLRMEIRH